MDEFDKTSFLMGFAFGYFNIPIPQSLTNGDEGEENES